MYVCMYVCVCGCLFPFVCVYNSCFIQLWFKFISKIIFFYLKLRVVVGLI